MSSHRMGLAVSGSSGFHGRTGYGMREKSYLSEEPDNCNYGRNGQRMLSDSTKLAFLPQCSLPALRRQIVLQARQPRGP